MLVSRSSFFVDSPLSKLGYDQAKALRAHLASDQIKGLQPGEEGAADAAALLGISGEDLGEVNLLYHRARMSVHAPVPAPRYSYNVADRPSSSRRSPRDFCR